MFGTTDDRTSSATLSPEPLSARSARRFVCEKLATLNRPEFADTAALAVTELATNVILHARTDFVVAVTEVTDRAVRVSVTDGSTALPVIQSASPASALGRGLRLVGQMTDAWGVERLDVSDAGGPGKTVWFELGGAAGANAVADANATYDPTVPDLLTGTPVPPAALVDVQLLNLPLQFFARETLRHRELTREMSLIAFGDDAEAEHVPARLTRLAAELESYRGVGAASDEVRDAALARGETAIDLVYRLPPAVGPACRRLNELLDEAEAYCRAENLLTLAATAGGVALRRWYLGEIADQIDGTEPRPWGGPLE
ncbi:MAG: ATP-binding protein [Actinomycetes bacterium]